jgi:hypothetical protein
MRKLSKANTRKAGAGRFVGRVVLAAPRVFAFKSGSAPGQGISGLELNSGRAPGERGQYVEGKEVSQLLAGAYAKAQPGFCSWRQRSGIENETRAFGQSAGKLTAGLSRNTL